MFKKVGRLFSEGDESELLPLCSDEPSTSTATPRLRSYGSFNPFWGFLRKTFSFGMTGYQVMFGQQFEATFQREQLYSQFRAI